MSCIIRIFRATTNPGKTEKFREFFLGDAVNIVRGFDGLISVQVGLPTEERPNEFMMTTVWKDYDALKAFAGDDWRQAYIDPREAPLIEHAYVEHFEQADL